MHPQRFGGKTRDLLVGSFEVQGKAHFHSLYRVEFVLSHPFRIFLRKAAKRMGHGVALHNL
jgi:hypothetical protein